MSATTLRDRHAKTWTAVFGRAPSESVFTVLASFYGGTDRHYHNWNHIQFLLGLHDQFAGQTAMSWPTAQKVELAIFWHDVVYDAGARNNEQRSADLFAMAARGSANNDHPAIGTVVEYILATTHEYNQAQPRSARYLCDLDLFGLSGSEKDFEANTVAIRQEFKATSNRTFLDGRCRWIEGLRNRGGSEIFYNPYGLAAFRDAEACAQRNLGREYERLSRLLDGYTDGFLL